MHILVFGILSFSMSTKWTIFARGSDIDRQGSRVVCGIAA